MSDDESSYDSTGDDSSSSEDEPKYRGVQKAKSGLSQFDGFDSDEEDSDDEIAQKMKAVLALRKSLGIDNDLEFMEEQKKKSRRKEAARILDC